MVFRLLPCSGPSPHVPGPDWPGGSAGPLEGPMYEGKENEEVCGVEMGEGTRGPRGC